MSGMEKTRMIECDQRRDWAREKEWDTLKLEG